MIPDLPLAKVPQILLGWEIIGQIGSCAKVTPITNKRVIIPFLGHKMTNVCTKPCSPS